MKTDIRFYLVKNVTSQNNDINFGNNITNVSISMTVQA